MDPDVRSWAFSKQTPTTPMMAGYESLQMDDGGFADMAPEIVARESMGEELPDLEHAGTVFQRQP